jgi:Ino eighty subunit 1
MMTEDEDVGTPVPSTTKPKSTRKRKEPAMAPGTNPAIYSGNKVKHLKKDDGEPLWRRDIQYDFLKAVFDDQQKVFTNSYEPTRPKQTFADLYIDTMARSSKTSKILKDKLLTEHAPAKNMAMVCLLVNLGRMNTTLNCTYPSILQWISILTGHSLPRDASTTSNISCYPVPTSPPRSKLIQATSRCPAVEVNS